MELDVRGREVEEVPPQSTNYSPAEANFSESSAPKGFTSV
jgi:hypothetical protein